MAQDLQSVVWNRKLIERYDLSGPRYTSYPTAPQFHDTFSAVDLDEAIACSNLKARPLSLYFHIPFCSRICYYCACNKIVTANRARSAPYLDRLCTEVQMQAPKFAQDRPVKQLHWGGGTPTFLQEDEMTRLMAATGVAFQLLDNDQGEYSIEIHPGDMAVSTIGHLRSLGFNRLSMGIQDFDPAVQQAVNRFNSVSQVAELVTEARKQGFHSISMDLIYGLPLQSVESFRRTLDHIIELSPDRLSVFNYAHMPHLFKTQRQIDMKALPEPSEKLAMMELASEVLASAGYCFIGMDHFAKPDDELVIAQQQGKLQRNFQGYATHGDCDMVAFGVSAISAIDNTFSQNHKQIDDYYAAIDGGELPLARGVVLNEDDRIRRRVISELICQFRLDFTSIEKIFGIDFSSYFADELTDLLPMEKDGLVVVSDKAIVVTPSGRLLIRRICMLFDYYARQQARENSNLIRYSKII